MEKVEIFYVNVYHNGLHVDFAYSMSAALMLQNSYTKDTRVLHFVRKETVTMAEAIEMEWLMHA